MQSRLFTAILAIVTLLFGSLAGIQLAKDDLSSIFGAPPRKVGELLYEFDPQRIHTVRISNNAGEVAVFKKQGGAWIMRDPVTDQGIDRADYRDLQRIVYFSRNLRVEDAIRRRDTTLAAAGMRETADHPGRFNLTLHDKEGHLMADYRLGRRTAWHRRNPKTGAVTETFFVRPEGAQKENIYVCSAPDKIQPSVRSILDRGFKRLRDHRPFLFDPATLADVAILQRDREVLLSREKPGRPWRMAKPLTSRTMPETMAGLLKGLYELQAVAVHDPKSVTIPPGEKPYLEIELRRFDDKGKRQARTSRMTVVEPPTTEDGDTVYATVNDRPGVVFELPFKPAQGRIALGQLPLAVDQLRGRTLASLDVRALRRMTIHHLAVPDPIEIFLGRKPYSGEPRWMINLNGDIAPANEIALGALLQAVSEDEVVNFASDAASDLGSFGLSPPQKRLVLRGDKGKAAESIDLFFGRGVDGKFYAMRRGSSTVAEIKPGTFTAIAAQPHNWRDTLIMPFSIVDLKVMKLEPRVRPPFADPSLILNYDFRDETWRARQNDENVSTRLNTQRANQFIKFMEDMRVEKWLGETSPLAKRALQNPTFRFTAVFNEVDDRGDRIGVRESSFELAPGSRSSRNRFYYGRLSGDPHYFVLSVDSYRQLNTRLVDPE